MEIRHLTVENTASNALEVVDSGLMRLHDIAVVGAADGVIVDGGTNVLERVSVSAAGVGVMAVAGSVTIDDSTLTGDSGFVQMMGSAVIRNSAISGPSFAVYAGVLVQADVRVIDSSVAGAVAADFGAVRCTDVWNASTGNPVSC